jgi:hypothetical protein
MAVPRWQALLVGFSSALVVLCTALLWMAPRPALVSSLPALPAAAGTQFRAFVFFRAADCSGNLSFARVFQRPRYRNSIHLTGVLLDGADEMPGVHSQLRRLGIAMPVVVAGRRLRQSIPLVDPRSGPFLVIVDGEGRLRHLMPGPRDPQETRSFLTLLDSLTAAEP